VKRGGGGEESGDINDGRVVINYEKGIKDN